MSDVTSLTVDDPASLALAVVDDTPDIRALLRMAFERSGQYKVIGEAENGQDAVELAAAQCPDVMLLDLAMPVMDGLSAAPLVRERCPDTTIVMLSAFDAAEMTDRALAAGAHGYIQKGMPMKKLVATVTEIVASHATSGSGPQRSSRLVAAERTRGPRTSSRGSVIRVPGPQMLSTASSRPAASVTGAETPQAEASYSPRHVA